MQVFRYDKGELTRSVKTAEGFLLVEGYIAKPGILQYIREDGSIQRELITADSLHDAASLATLGRKPATLEHPAGNVTPDNVGDLAVGDVDGEVIVVAGGFVKVRMAIRRRDALDSISHGDKMELSPGYTVTLDETPGTHPDFGDYDAVQTNRRYNHVALTSMGRGGPSIRLRADSAADTNLFGAPTMDPRIIAALAAALSTTGVRVDSATLAKADASDVASHIGALADAFVAATKDALADKTDQEGAEGAEGSEGADDDEEEITEDGFEAAEDEEKADSRRLAWHTARVALAARADAHGVKVDGKSNRALRKAIVIAARTDARTDASGDYYAAAFDMLPKAGADRADAWGAVKLPERKAGEERVDAPPAGGWKNTIADAATARFAK